MLAVNCARTCIVQNVYPSPPFGSRATWIAVLWIAVLRYWRRAIRLVRWQIEDLESGRVPSTHNQNISRWLLAAAALSCGFQLVWFGSRCIHQIDIDGIDYIGIARHLRSHQFYSAINDFRSPLLSWMIAAGSFFDGDLVRVGKALNIGSYLLCGVLLYFFAKSLWHSELAASLAVIWFSLSRGLSVVAVGMVTPDFLFAALTLAYFIVLLQCLRTDEKRWWGLLGGVHALAFLAKAFALPWLG